MARKRKRIKASVIAKIKKEAGGKCANPGCHNIRTDIHHIKEWAVYQTNDERILVAVCPSCHDAIHHGAITIDDETLLQWKSFKRPSTPLVSHLFVEPANVVTLRTGMISITSKKSGVTVFRLSDNHRLGFRIIGGDLFIANLVVSDLAGNVKIDITDNYIRVVDHSSITVSRIPGRVIVTSPEPSLFLTTETVNKMRIKESDYLSNGVLTLLDIKVTGPGRVTVAGCWSSQEKSVIITDKYLSLITKEMPSPLSICGESDKSFLLSDGPIDTSLFSFHPASKGVLHI